MRGTHALLTSAAMAAAILFAATPARAQLTPTPAGGGPVQVAACRSCCSIWDALGVQQLGQFGSGLMKTSLGQALMQVVGPVGRALGLGPSLMADAFKKAPPGSAMNVANKIKTEEKKAPLKIKALRYLATQDCNCYPEVIDAILAALEDCTEEVRYEALKALHRCKTEGGKHCKSCAGKKSCPTDDPFCAGCNCQCKEKVIQRLQEYLLKRDEFGCYKEQSARCRDLAAQMIQECLTLRQPPPPEATGPVETKEPKVAPETAPRVRPETGAMKKSAGEQPVAKKNSILALPVSGPAARARGEAKEVANPAQATEKMVAPASTSTKSSAIAAPVDGQSTNRWGRSKAPTSGMNRHLLGEVFGY